MNFGFRVLPFTLLFAGQLTFAQVENPPEGTGYETTKKGQPTFVISNTPIEIYGHVDLSIDAATKGIAGRTTAAGGIADGSLGWQGDVSSNLSYLGIRGNRAIADGGDYKVAFQLETQVDMSAMPGATDNGASGDAAVKGALASRNSYVGLTSFWGGLKVGKNDTPYKYSTAKLDPFSATVGDYNAIMGNTGGDNRAEFDPRFAHAVWYESPTMGGFRFQVMASPGQNRGTDNSGIPTGEPSCNGGNNPINTHANDGTTICGDGSYGDAYSVAASYEVGTLYTTAAYELHTKTNRRGDEATFGGGAPDGSVGVGDEYGMKVGAQYTLPSRTTINAILESLVRQAPNNSYNERTRTGYWLAVSQKLNDHHTVNVGWGHANRTPGDPGEVFGRDGNTHPGPVDNAADLVDVGYQYNWAKNLNLYAVYATMMNHDMAHYDLGASGHGVMTDCHDGTAPAGNFSGGGAECFAGGTLQAFSVGMQYDF